jgi:murein DD-endopeptidase MepM/ murein hydrolase activator NlpD
MTQPLKEYKYNLPTTDEPGSFGYIRRYDIHTGVDMYCSENDEVFAIEDGVVINIEKFTGESAGSPWWNDTQSILIEGNSGVILYGEIEVSSDITIGSDIKEGDLLGVVKTVLKRDKGKTPLNMLHMELYKKGTTESVWWDLNSDKPENLLNVNDVLMKND